MSARNTLEAKARRRKERTLRHEAAAVDQEARIVGLWVQMVLGCLGTVLREIPDRRTRRGNVTHERGRF